MLVCRAASGSGLKTRGRVVIFRPVENSNGGESCSGSRHKVGSSGSNHHSSSRHGHGGSAGPKELQTEPNVGHLKCHKSLCGNCEESGGNLQTVTSDWNEPATVAGKLIKITRQHANSPAFDGWRVLISIPGPFTAKKQVSEQDYLISMPTGKSRLCHVNLLKPYYDRMSSPSSKEAPCVKPASCVDTELSSSGG